MYNWYQSHVWYQLIIRSIDQYLTSSVQPWHKHSTIDIDHRKSIIDPSIDRKFYAPLKSIKTYGYLVAIKMAAILEQVELEREREGIMAIPHAQRVFKDRTVPLEAFPDADLRRKYRFSIEGLLHLVGILGPLLELHTRRNRTMPPSLQNLHYSKKKIATQAVLDSTATIHGV